MNAVYIGIFWALYYVLHSVLAAGAVKRFFRRALPHMYPHYRAWYSVIAAANFILLAWLHIRLPSEMLFEPVWGVRLAAWMCGMAGVAVLFLSVRQYGASFFFIEDRNKDTLITSGLNSYVRHPLYFGVLLLTAFLVLLAPSEKNATFAVITAVYIVLGSLHEEHRLIARFGDAYRDYRKRVKMLIPYVF